MIYCVGHISHNIHLATIRVEGYISRIYIFITYKFRFFRINRSAYIPGSRKRILIYSSIGKSHNIHLATIRAEDYTNRNCIFKTYIFRFISINRSAYIPGGRERILIYCVGVIPHNIHFSTIRVKGYTNRNCIFKTYKFRFFRINRSAYIPGG
ncbi:hypothetical protein ES705_46316 [subsurface metagenome]